MREKRVVLLAASLDNMAGGLERNIIRLAGLLAARGHTIDLVSFDRDDARAFYPVAANVAWHRIGRSAPHGPITFMQRLCLVASLRAILLPDANERVIAIAFHHGLLPRLVLAAAGLRIRLICAERSALTIYDHIRARKTRPAFLLLYAMRRIVVQFPGYIKDYPRALRSRIVAIPNIVEPARAQAAPDRPGPDGRFRLLAVGRLSAQKNFDLLIAAFAGLAVRFPDWDLYIAGDGELRPALQRQIDAAGLAARVTLAGATPGVAALYASAHLFCLPSRWEGFPNALAEAMAAGLPCVGYAGCAGVRDLIEDGINGRLAPASDVDSLAAALADLMADPLRCSTLGAAARLGTTIYDADSIIVQWQALLA